MPEVFATGDPEVGIVHVPLPRAVPARVAVYGDASDQASYLDNSDLIIITQIGFKQAPSFQLTRTLGRSVYMYVFGDKEGDIRIQGMVFSKVCDQEGGLRGGGIDRVLDYYDEYKPSADAAAPPQVVTQIGSRTFRGFLTELSVNTLTDQADTNISAFQMSLITMPESLVSRGLTVNPSVRSAADAAQVAEAAASGTGSSVTSSANDNFQIIRQNSSNPLVSDASGNVPGIS